jgi:predicted TIM-barrel fold metal-dependent hydrolase
MSLDVSGKLGEAHDVPIMAHANESSGPYPAFETLAGSEHWERALKQFPGLRLSFGHFGDTDLEETEGQSRTRAFLQMMRMTEGQNVYADSGYFAGVLGHLVAMEDALKSLLRE